jgi:hypothetical protein
MLNQKGQEFSVFKLLISAIVAIVILTLLLQILGIIDFNPNTDPANAAENLLKDIDSQVYTEKVSKKLDFKKENSISSLALADSVGLSSEQICLLLDSDLTSLGFSDNGGTSLITYSGSSTVRVKLAGICSRSGNDIDSAIQNSTAIINSKSPDVTSCNFDPDLKACVLLLFRSDE